MGYKTKSMLHLASVNSKKTVKENKAISTQSKGSYANPGDLFPEYKPTESTAISSGTNAAALGVYAVNLAGKLKGTGRSTGNFDKKIVEKEKKGNMAGAARAERREAKWDYRQNKKAKKISAKTEGTYQPEKKASKDAREDFKRTETASELKENQLRRANAAKEETKPAGDTGSDIVGITNTGTGGFGESAASGFNSSNYTDFGKNYVPEKPVFNKKNRFTKIEPNVNIKNPGKGGETPTKVLTEDNDYSDKAVEGFIKAAAKVAHERKFPRVKPGESNAKQFYAEIAAEKNKKKAITDAKRNVIPSVNK